MTLRILTALAALIAGTACAALCGYMAGGMIGASFIVWWLSIVYTGALAAFIIASAFCVLAHTPELFAHFERERS